MRAALAKLSRSRLGTILKLLCSVGLLALFFHGIDLAKVSAAAGKLSAAYLLVLLGLVVLRNVAMAARARAVLSVVRRVPLLRLSEHYFIASLFNTFLPSMIGGDGARVLLVRSCGVPAKEGALLILLERLVGLYTLLALACVSAWAWDVPDELLWAVSAAMLVATMGIAWLFFGRGRAGDASGRFATVRAVLARIRETPRLLLPTGLLSLAAQLIGISVSYYVATELLGPLSIVPFLTLVPLVWFFAMIPITLGGLGLREIAFVYLLQTIAISQEDALVISLGSYLGMVASGLIGAGYLLYRRLAPPEPAAGAPTDPPTPP